MRKLGECQNDPKRFLYFCPGCDQCHEVTVDGQLNSVGASWSWNGDLDEPTFTPSILIRYQSAGKPFVCHSYVTEGRVQFLSDCTHQLAGQTVEIPAWETLQ